MSVYSFGSLSPIDLLNFLRTTPATTVAAGGGGGGGGRNENRDQPWSPFNTTPQGDNQPSVSEPYGNQMSLEEMWHLHNVISSRTGGPSLTFKRYVQAVEAGPSWFGGVTRFLAGVGIAAGWTILGGAVAAEIAVAGLFTGAGMMAAETIGILAGSTLAGMTGPMGSPEYQVGLTIGGLLGSHAARHIVYSPGGYGEMADVAQPGWLRETFSNENVRQVYSEVGFGQAPYDPFAFTYGPPGYVHQ